MAINPGAVGAVGEPVERSWTSKDCLLYALGVGTGADDPLSELEFTTENSHGIEQKVLPSYAVIAGSAGAPWKEVGEFDFAKLVHGEQSFEVFGPISANGRVSVTGRIAEIWDKGKGAVVVTECDSVDPDSGELRFRTRASAFIRGEGGFGGERGPSSAGSQVPDRDPDHVVTYRTRPDQALLYRLSGDRNALHSDPAFAARAGFDRPILHGLCTFGFTGRALLHSLCSGDPARFRSMSARFTSPVYPGDGLTVKIWTEGEGEAVFRTETQRAEIAVDQGRCTFAASGG
ncbi:MAG TPA: MaoC/PaaZ C-terminal domain-containing protein [Acidimicrobiales bacterium]|nr:MaoC/PaaZ C-terminal domain-containing protein [Acidimicrobiales bacterium]